MFKKIPLWLVLILIIFTLIISAVMTRQEIEGSSKAGIISKSFYFISLMPARIKYLISDEFRYPYKANKKTYNDDSFINYKNLEKYNSLILISRWNQEKKLNTIDIYELKNFQLIGNIDIDLKKIFSKVNLKKKDYELNPNKFDFKRLRVLHPLIKNDGNIIFHSESRLIEIDLCGNFIRNSSLDDGIFHHSISSNKDESYFWSSIYLTKQPDDFKIKTQISKNFIVNGIVKFDNDLNILFKKSIYEILFDNKIVGDGFFLKNDPDHLNDVEIANFDSDYFLKDDIFLSLRDFNQILHYRPSENKIIRTISGPFSSQHDVDIISENEIMIFNNNNLLKNGKNSNLVVYNFETKSFSNIFKKELDLLNLKTRTEGLADKIENKGYMIEETNGGRIIILDKMGNIDLEYLNKSKNKLFYLNWSRMIDDPKKISVIKEKFKNKKCLN